MLRWRLASVWTAEQESRDGEAAQPVEHLQLCSPRASFARSRFLRNIHRWWSRAPRDSQAEQERGNKRTLSAGQLATTVCRASLMEDSSRAAASTLSASTR